MTANHSHSTNKIAMPHYSFEAYALPGVACYYESSWWDTRLRKKDCGIIAIPKEVPPKLGWPESTIYRIRIYEPNSLLGDYSVCPRSAEPESDACWKVPKKPPYWTAAYFKYEDVPIE